MKKPVADKKKKKADYKWEYPVNMRLGIIGALIINIALFTLIPRFEVNPQKRSAAEILEAADILEAEDLPEELPEEETAVPIEAESEEEVEAETIGKTEFEEVYTKAESSVKAREVPYARVEEKPVPLHSPKPVYPDAARAKEQEGQVIIEALVDVDGKVIEVKVAKSCGYPSLDEAAKKAAWQWTFKPGKQRGEPVRVRVHIPFNFTLRG